MCPFLETHHVLGRTRQQAPGRLPERHGGSSRRGVTAVSQRRRTFGPIEASVECGAVGGWRSSKPKKMKPREPEHTAPMLHACTSPLERDKNHKDPNGNTEGHVGVKTRSAETSHHHHSCHHQAHTHQATTRANALTVFLVPVRRPVARRPCTR